MVGHWTVTDCSVEKVDPLIPVTVTPTVCSEPSVQVAGAVKVVEMVCPPAIGWVAMSKVVVATVPGTGANAYDATASAAPSSETVAPFQASDPVFFTESVTITAGVVGTYVAEVWINPERLFDEEPASPNAYAATAPAMAIVITINRRAPMRFEIPNFLLRMTFALKLLLNMPYRKHVCL